MTISNRILKASAAAIVLGIVGWGSFAGYRAWKGNADYIASLRSEVSSQSGRADVAEKSLADKTAEATGLESELAQTNERYGVAVSEKSAAESAKAKADAAKAKAEGDAASANQKAAAASNEAAWQRGQAEIANGNLAACSSNVDALGSLVYYVDQQRQYNLSAVSAMNDVTTYLLAGDVYSASSSMDSALWYIGKADDLQPSVDYWLGQIE